MTVKHKFDSDYFSQGPYAGVLRSGFRKYLGKFYWARRFYARQVKKMTPAGSKILEIGCGYGDLLHFLEDDYQTYGTDISAPAIKTAKQRLHKTNLTVLAAEKTMILPEKFRTIIAAHVLEHLDDPDEVLRQISIVLVKGGNFLMIVPNSDSWGHRIKGTKWIGYKDKTHISLFSPQQWRLLLDKNGFKIKSLFGDGLWDSPYLPFIPVILQKIIFSLPAILQTLSGVPFIPVKWGESVVFLARKEKNLF